MTNALDQARKLPEPLYSFFWSDEPRFLCENICFQYGVDEDSIGKVSRFVAPLLVKAMPLANLPQELHAQLPQLSDEIIFGIAYELNQKILGKFPEKFPEGSYHLNKWHQRKSTPILSEQDARKKTLELEQWYLEWRQQEKQSASQQEKPTIKTTELPLIDALGKYTRLSEQNITENRITIKGESTPVRGTLRNWIRSYRDALGIRKHSPLERGQFIFQGGNARAISPSEREKLTLIFRSLDENTPLSIDTERQEIIFTSITEKPKPPIPMPPTKELPAKDFEQQQQQQQQQSKTFAHDREVTPTLTSQLHFSSKHLLPYEEESQRKTIHPKNTATKTP